MTEQTGVLAIVPEMSNNSLHFYTMLPNMEPECTGWCRDDSEKSVCDALQLARVDGVEVVAFDPLFQSASWVQLIKNAGLGVSFVKCTKSNFAPYNLPDYLPSTIGPVICRIATAALRAALS